MDLKGVYKQAISTHRLHSSSFLGLPYRILNIHTVPTSNEIAIWKASDDALDSGLGVSLRCHRCTVADNRSIGSPNIYPLNP